MLLLNLNSDNTLYVQCTDILTVESPVYLWRFYHHQLKKEYLIELDRAATSNERVDIYSLTLPDDLDLPTGEYSWEIHESETSGDEDYEEMNMLSNGTARVAESFDTNDQYQPTGNDTVYNG